MPRRAVFVDPSGDAERLWAIDQALRCRGVACVIADGSRLEMAASRRLQLAAREGGTLGLLARPLGELGELSAARTRWRAQPAPNLEARWFPEPAWTLELLRCKGLRPTTDARRWTVRVHHDTGDVSVVPDAPDRRVATPRPSRTA
jgi:protein ImuA